MRQTLAAGAVLSCLSAGLLAGSVGCSFHASIGKKDAVSKDDVSHQISDKMTDAQGNKPESVSCPGDLPAKVGSSIDCTMQVKGTSYGVNVTVTSVNGDDVKFDMIVTVDKDQVAEEVSNQLAQQAGRKPDSVTCPQNLKGKVGATLRCELVDNGQTWGVTVTVTAVEGSDVKFDIKVDDQPK